MKKRKSPMQVSFWLNKINPKTNKLFTENEAILHIKSFRKSNLEYWLTRGYSYEEAKIQQFNFQHQCGKNGNAVLKQNPQKCSTKIEYWLAKGYSYEEAKLQLKNRQSTFSLKKCINKYGEIDGLKIFNNRQEKWQKTLKNKSKTELKKINKSKNIFSKFFGKNIIRDENFFKELEYVCKKRKNLFISDVNQLKNYICNLFKTTAFIQNKGINYFMKKICPSYLYKVLGIQKKTVITWLQDLQLKIQTDIPYYVDSGKIHSYHMVADDNSILISKHEIVFYLMLKDKKIKIESINKTYPNSGLKFDFKVNGYYIEIAGLMYDNIYKSKILYKRKLYNSFVLISETEYEDFIQTVLIDKNEEKIKYYLTRPL